MLDNKFLGLPLVLWLVIVGTALLVDIPMTLLNVTTQQRINDVQVRQFEQQMLLRRVTAPVATPSAEVVPTDTPTPTTVFRVRQPFIPTVKPTSK